MVINIPVQGELLPVALTDKLTPCDSHVTDMTRHLVRAIGRRARFGSVTDLLRISSGFCGGRDWLKIARPSPVRRFALRAAGSTRRIVLTGADAHGGIPGPCRERKRTQPSSRCRTADQAFAAFASVADRIIEQIIE